MSKQQHGRSIRRRVAVAAAIAALGAPVALASPASAGWADCSSGNYLGSGRWCYWAGANFQATPQAQYSTSAQGYSINVRSNGNRINNRSVSWYNQSNVLISCAPPQTGRGDRNVVASRHVVSLTC